MSKDFDKPLDTPLVEYQEVERNVYRLDPETQQATVERVKEKIPLAQFRCNCPGMRSPWRGRAIASKFCGPKIGPFAPKRAALQARQVRMGD